MDFLGTLWIYSEGKMEAKPGITIALYPIVLLYLIESLSSTYPQSYPPYGFVTSAYETFSCFVASFLLGAMDRDLLSAQHDRWTSLCQAAANGVPIPSLVELHVLLP